MSKVTRSKLKTYFQTGDQPTENEFIDVFDSTLNLSEDNSITGSLIISGSDVSLLVQGDITSTGDIIASRLNTGQGLNELYDMDQNVKTTSAVTFTTVNTGQGANELYDMNQNVKVQNNVAFAGLTLNKTDYGSLNLASATLISAPNALAGKLEVRAVPSIDAGASSPTYTLVTDAIITTSVVMMSTNALITCNATTITAGSCKITFHNPTETDYAGGNIQANIVIL
tara:strand:+ start:1240 stop:1920 length:681 start_codon:yes stop_codon:yes gene_type:complete